LVAGGAALVRHSRWEGKPKLVHLLPRLLGRRRILRDVGVSHVFLHLLAPTVAAVRHGRAKSKSYRGKKRKKIEGSYILSYQKRRDKIDERSFLSYIIKIRDKV
jgi:hypothetical protein